MIRLKKFRVISFILTVILFFNMALFFDGGISLAADVNLLIEKLVSTDEVDVGEVFTYTIKYSNPNTTTDANDVVLTDLLPDGISYVSSTVTPDIQNVEVTDVGGREQVKFIFKDPLPAGVTGILKITAKFNPGVTADNTIRTNQAIITPTNGPSVISNEVSVTAKIKPGTWSVSKERTIPSSVLPALNQPVTYEIIITGNSSIGGINLKDVTAVDELPTGSTFVSSSDGTYNSSSHTITWDIGTLNVGSTIKKQVTVMYRTSAGLTTSSIVENEVEVTGTPLYSSESETKTGSAEHGFTTKTAQVGNLTKTSRQSNDEYSSGQTAQFYIGNINNSGNVPLTNFNIVDTIPNSIDLERITSGVYNQSGLLDIYYKSNKKDWTLWRDGISRSSSTTLNTSDLGFGSNEYVTHVKWDFGTVDSGFSNTSNINVSGEILDVIRTAGGVAVRTNASITNEADLFATDDEGNNLSDHAEVTIEVVDPKPWLDPSKIRLGKSAYYDEERVSFKLTLKNHNYATGDLEDPAFIDILPQELEDIQIESCSVSPAPTFSTYKKTIDGEERDLFKWTFTGKTLEPGETIDITYSGKIKDGTLVGNVDNIMYMTITDDFKASSKENDVLDIDSDSNTDYLVQSEASFFVKFVGTLSSDKWLNGELDSDWSKYPAQGKTLPGGIADYQLKVRNTDSNGPIGNIVVIDILPYIGDIGLLDTKARETEWRPYLVNEIKIVSLPAGADADEIKLYYSTSDSPDLSQLYNPLNKNNSDWNETPPEDITTVKSLKFDFGDIELNVNEEIVLEWPMRAPAGAPVNKPAWNSFGYGATYPDENGPEPFLPSEPIKVGYYIQADPSSTVNLGDYVWEDINKNGIQDAGEPGINGVLVELLDDAGNPVDGKYTRTGFDQNGNPGCYLFPNLSAGNYKVKFTVPDGYQTSLQNQGGDDAIDSDINVTGTDAGITDVISLDGINDNLDADAGIYRLGSIGDLVWNDKDTDGIKDSGEPGLEGIRVNLYDDTDTLLGNRTTSAIGLYEFTDLDPGKYYVEVITDGKYKISPSIYGNDRNNFTSTSSISGKSQIITLTSGENNPTIDAGMYLGSIGDFVWHDMDADGLQESEAGIKDITVNLYKDGIQTESTTTDNSGYYLFDDLFPAAYIVEVIKNGYDKYSPQYAGSDIELDSNGYPTGSNVGKSEPYNLKAGERISTIDQGLYNLASLGDIVWNDINHNGQQDSGEPGVENVTVELYDSTHNKVSETTTSSIGWYTFDNLEPGNYYVQFIVPADYAATTKDYGTDDAIDSDIDVYGKTDIIVLKSGDNITNVDAGIHRAILGDFVWEDINGDSIQNDGDTGINGVVVNLYDSHSKLKSTQTASKDGKEGYYEFSDLAPGDYYLEFVKPDGYDKVEQDKGDDSKDSDYNVNTNRTEAVHLDSGEVDMTLDAGYYQPASLGDYVWDDLNLDGIQGSDESGVSNVTVVLKQGNTQITTTLTDDNGKYLFTGLKPGSYYVEFVKPNDFGGFTTKDFGSDSDDSDADSSGKTSNVTLISNETNLTCDAGLYHYASIGDYVWHDENVDGIQDGTEVGISNVSVILYRENDIGVYEEVSTTTTTAVGYYEFNQLIPDNYKVKVVVPDGYKLTNLNSGSNDQVDSDFNSSDSETEAFFLKSGESNLSLDAGMYKLSQLGNFVWLDKNADGIQDDGENGLDGIEIKLLDASDTELATTSAIDGYYLFDNLDLGEYKIKVILPDDKGYIVTKKDSTDDTKDSDIDYLTRETELIQITSSNISNLTLDAGLYETAAIGDYVWEDMNFNGTQETTEPAIKDVNVTLILSDNSTEGAITADNGFYQFIDLVPGTYKVQFDTPESYILTSKYSGKDDTVDSNPNKDTLLTDDIVLESKQVISTIDAGFYRTARIGDYVWLDKNKNGIQDSGEKGVEGVSVKLILSDDMTLETKTDENGLYEFNNITPGAIKVVFTAPGRHKFTKLIVGHEDTDSNANTSTGSSDEIILLSNGEDLTIDAGIYFVPEFEEEKLGSLGNYVWYDTNYNGLQDPEEDGVSGIKVTLISPYGKNQTTMTNSKGKYLFEDLEMGSYSLEFEKPEGYDFTIPEAGDSSKDSDVSQSGKVYGVFLDEEENRMDIDAGLVGTSELGDFAFIDQNENNLQDDEDRSIEGLIIKLYNDSDELVAETTTDADGYYKFEKLFPGEYYIKVDKPDGYSFITKDAGDDTLDSDISSKGESEKIILDVDESNLTLDIGLKKSSEGDEPIDAEEPGDEEVPIEGGDVVIKDEDGNVIKEDTIDEDGNIDLTDLPKNIPLTITITKDGVVIDEIIIEIPDEEIPLSNIDLRDFGVLPKTGTHDYNLLLLGFILLAVGVCFTVIHHRKKRN